MSKLYSYVVVLLLLGNVFVFLSACGSGGTEQASVPAVTSVALKTTEENTVFTISWKEPDNTNDISYYYVRVTSTVDKTIEVVKSVSVGKNNIDVVLEQSSTYSVSVEAIGTNAAYSIALSETSYPIEIVQEPKPSIPGDPTKQNNDGAASALNISWTAATIDSTSASVEYRVYYIVHSTQQASVAELLVSGNISPLTTNPEIILSDLLPNTDYDLFVRAYNSEDSDYYASSNVVTIFTDDDTLGIRDIRTSELSYGDRKYIYNGEDYSYAFERNTIPAEATVTYAITQMPPGVDGSIDGNGTVYITTNKVAEVAEGDYTMTITASPQDAGFKGTASATLMLTKLAPVYYKADEIEVAREYFTIGDVASSNLFTVDAASITRDTIAGVRAEISIISAPDIDISYTDDTPLLFDASDDSNTPDMKIAVSPSMTQTEYSSLKEKIFITVIVKDSTGIPFAGERISVIISPPTDIYTWRDLQAMQENLDLDYEIKNNIQFPAKDTHGFDTPYFIPVGTKETPFTGSLDGNGFTIDGMVINHTGANVWAGLFGYAMFNENKVAIQNIHIKNADITGTGNVGALAGELDLDTNTREVLVNNIVVEDSSISSSAYVGGLVGNNKVILRGQMIGGSITVRGTATETALGGLVGINYNTIIGLSSTNISGRYNVGGLVGRNSIDSVGYANYIIGVATGNTSGTSIVGGLVGRAFGRPHVIGYWSAANTSTTEGVASVVGSGAIFDMKSISDIANVVFDNDSYSDNGVQVFNNETFLKEFDLPGISGAWPTFRKWSRYW